jgi:hypothetical protein
MYSKLPNRADEKTPALMCVGVGVGFVVQTRLIGHYSLGEEAGTVRYALLVGGKGTPRLRPLVSKHIIIMDCWERAYQTSFRI